MKGKNLEVSLLLDFYGDMLTENQREALELYYNEDLSLAEIAEHTHISRQGVRDSIKRGELSLFEMESKLELAKRFYEIQNAVKGILAAAREIEDYNSHKLYSTFIMEKVNQIIELAKSISEQSPERGETDGV